MMDHSNTAIPNSVRFWLFLITVVPSMGCSILILYHIFSRRSQRRAINNHVIILLLCNNLLYELINTPLYLNYYRLNIVSPPSPNLCIMWMFVQESLFTVSTVTVAWASIERHILIFHERLLSTARGRLLIHYIPLATLLIYIIIFHFIVIVAVPCKNTYDYTLEICGSPLCLHDTPFIGTWDSLVHGIMPTVVIVVFSISLLLRVLFQNYRARKAVQWRKHRKIAIQLLSISLLYVLLYIPGMCIELSQLCCSNNKINSDFEEYAHFFSHYVIFLLPFVYIVALMGKSWKLRKMLLWWRLEGQSVHPLELHTQNLVPHNLRPVALVPHH